MTLCCSDLENLIDNNRDLLILDKNYGWILKWIELTDEPGYTQVHPYAMKVSFCPFCGESLNHARTG